MILEKSVKFFCLHWACTLISSAFSFIQGFIMTGISNQVTYNLRKDISVKINKIPLKYFESRTHGEILSRITNDIDTLQTSINQSFTQLITSVTMLIGVLIMMLSINVYMTVAAILILPISMMIIGKVMKHSQGYLQQQQKYLGEVNGQVEEIYSGHNVVKAFNKEEDVIREFEKTNEKLVYHRMAFSVFLRNDDADYAVCGKCGICYGGSFRRIFSN